MGTDLQKNQTPGNHSRLPGKGVKPEETLDMETQQHRAVVIHVFCQPQVIRWVEQNPAYLKTDFMDVPSSFYETKILVQPKMSKVDFLG